MSQPWKNMPVPIPYQHHTTAQQDDRPYEQKATPFKKAKAQSYRVILCSTGRIDGTIPEATYKIDSPIVLDKDTTYIVGVESFYISTVGSQMDYSDIIFAIEWDVPTMNVFEVNMGKHTSRSGVLAVFKGDSYIGAPHGMVGAILNSTPTQTLSMFTIRLKTPVTNVTVPLDESYVLTLNISPYGNN